MTKIIRGPQDREMWDIIMKEMLYLLNASFVMVMIFNVTFNNTQKNQLPYKNRGIDHTRPIEIKHNCL
jgi:hypothetical protein